MNTPRLLTNRRTFLKTLGAATAVGGASLPRLAAVAVESSGPSERIALGCIGLGIQGMGNMGEFLKLPEVQVVAVCDVHDHQRSRGKQAVDAGYQKQDCAAYKDFRDLIAHPGLDAVLICTPDHWHPLIAIEAARQRKHIYCEKPIGWSFRAAQAVRKAVNEHGVVFQFGTQQRSDWKFRFACELVRNGRIGKLQTILVGVPGSVSFPHQPTEAVPKELDYDLWLGPAPYAPYSFERCRPFTSRAGATWTNQYSIWYHISDYCVGFIGNWGIHHLDIAQWGNGTEDTGPVEVAGTGEFPKEGMADCALRWKVENRFANGVTLVHMDDQTSKEHPLQVGGFGHGVGFLGSGGWVHVDRERILTKPEDLIEVKFGPGDVQLLRSASHHQNFVDAIRGRSAAAAPIDVAVRSDTIYHLDQIAIKLNRKLAWDPVKEQFVNDAQANALLDRPMRAPWELPS